MSCCRKKIRSIGRQLRKFDVFLCEAIANKDEMQSHSNGRAHARCGHRASLHWDGASDSKGWDVLCLDLLLNILMHAYHTLRTKVFVCYQVCKNKVAKRISSILTTCASDSEIHIAVGMINCTTVFLVISHHQINLSKRSSTQTELYI